MFFLIPLDMQTILVCIRVDHETPSGGQDFQNSKMRVSLSVVLNHQRNPLCAAVDRAAAAWSGLLYETPAGPL